MTILILLAAFIIIIGAGYWFTGRLDHALADGQLISKWDSNEGQPSTTTVTAEKKAS